MDKGRKESSLLARCYCVWGNDGEGNIVQHMVMDCESF